MDPQSKWKGDELVLLNLSGRGDKDYGDLHQ